MAIPRVPGRIRAWQPVVFAVIVAWSVVMGTRAARAQDQVPPPDPTPVEADAGTRRADKVPTRGPRPMRRAARS